MRTQLLLEVILVAGYAGYPRKRNETHFYHEASRRPPGGDQGESNVPFYMGSKVMKPILLRRAGRQKQNFMISREKWLELDLPKRSGFLTSKVSFYRDLAA